FGQIEIMYTGAPRRFRDCDVAVVGQAGNHGVDGLLLEVRIERRRVRSVERVRMQILEAMRVDHCICSLAAHVCEMHLVRAGLGEQAGDERSDLAGAEDENFGHADLRKRAAILGPRTKSPTPRADGMQFRQRCYAAAMTRNPDLIAWHPASWQGK